MVAHSTQRQRVGFGLHVDKWGEIPTIVQIATIANRHHLSASGDQANVTGENVPSKIDGEIERPLVDGAADPPEIVESASENRASLSHRWSIESYEFIEGWSIETSLK